MTGYAASLLIDLGRRGIRLRVAGDKLRAAPKAAMTPALLASMTGMKAEVLDALVEGFGRVPPHWSPEGWRKHLLHMSEVCARNHPQRAEYFRMWADALALT